MVLRDTGIVFMYLLVSQLKPVAFPQSLESQKLRLSSEDLRNEGNPVMAKALIDLACINLNTKHWRWNNTGLDLVGTRRILQLTWGDSYLSIKRGSHRWANPACWRSAPPCLLM